MSVKVHREDSGVDILELDTVEAAAAWVIRLFTEHNWDAPRAVIMRAQEPDATPEEKAAARRLWPRYDPKDYHIRDEAGCKHRVQRDGTITIDPDRTLQGEAEGAPGVDDTGDPAGDAGPDEGADVRGDSEGPTEGGQRRGRRSSPTAVE